MTWDYPESWPEHSINSSLLTLSDVAYHMLGEQAAKTTPMRRHTFRHTFRCIGCGKFLPNSRNWNQCSDCDTRTYEDY